MQNSVSLRCQLLGLASSIDQNLVQHLVDLVLASIYLLTLILRLEGAFNCSPMAKSLEK